MSFWSTPIKIGNRLFPRFIGGPLDGITDSPFRSLVRDFSKEELLYTEMRHIRCIAHEKGGQRALRFSQLERPLNYQIAANSIEGIEQACEKIMQAGIDAVDLNIGCPARNVIGSGSGSALMGDLPRLKEIVTRLRAEITVPFTVKIRAGFKEKNAVEVAKLLEGCGVDAIAIHPRLQTQRFEGRPDYAIARDVKQAVSIPIIISGGVVNWATARMVYEQTGVDGFLIGRGIWARPWKLKELREHSSQQAYSIDKKTNFRYALKHLDRMLEYYGDSGLYAFRKHLPFYLRGQKQAGTLRSSLMVCGQADTLRKQLETLVEADE